MVQIILIMFPAMYVIVVTMSHSDSRISAIISMLYTVSDPGTQCQVLSVVNQAPCLPCQVLGLPLSFFSDIFESIVQHNWFQGKSFISCIIEALPYLPVKNLQPLSPLFCNYIERGSDIRWHLPSCIRNCKSLDRIVTYIEKTSPAWTFLRVCRNLNWYGQLAVTVQEYAGLFRREGDIGKLTLVISGCELTMLFAQRIWWTM